VDGFQPAGHPEKFIPAPTSPLTPAPPRVVCICEEIYGVYSYESQSRRLSVPAAQQPIATQPTAAAQTPAAPTASQTPAVTPATTAPKQKKPQQQQQQQPQQPQAQPQSTIDLDLLAEDPYWYPFFRITQ